MALEKENLKEAVLWESNQERKSGVNYDGNGYFDLNVTIDRIESINFCMVWLVYNSWKNNLLEPKLEKSSVCANQVFTICF